MSGDVEYTAQRHALLMATFDGTVDFRPVPPEPGGDGFAWFVRDVRATPSQEHDLTMLSSQGLLRACDTVTVLGEPRRYKIGRPRGIDTLVLWHQAHPEGKRP